jgi:hypothetical protein
MYSAMAKQVGHASRRFTLDVMFHCVCPSVVTVNIDLF